MLKDFIDQKLQEARDVIAFHKEILGINENITSNSYLNKKELIYNLTHMFSLLDKELKDRLLKQLLDDILSIIEFFDTSDTTGKLQLYFKELNNSDISFDTFKKEFTSQLKHLRIEVMPIINTKLYYYDMMLWRKAKRSNAVLKFLRIYELMNCENSLTFSKHMSGEFTPFINVKYSPSVYDINTEYLQEDIEYIKSLSEYNLSKKDTERIEIFDKLISVKHKIEIFKGMNDADLALVVKDIKFMRYAEHEMIIKEGDISDEIYFILSGSCRVVVGDHSVGKLKAHQVCGEFSAISKEKRGATIRTNEPVTALSFKLALELFDKIPDSFSVLYKNVINEIIKKVNLSNKKQY